MTDKLSALGGVRRKQDNRNSYQLNIIPSTENDALPSFGGAPVKPSSGTAVDTDYRVGLDYKLDKDVLLYLYEATGYIAGGTQQLTNKLLAPNTVRTLTQ